MFNRFSLLALACTLALFCGPVATPALAVQASICDTPQFLTQNAGAICQQQFATSNGVTKTRPANTTQYTANTAWADATTGASAWVFSNICRNTGRTIEISTIHLLDAANQSTKLQGTLYLFDHSPTALNDNGAFTIASGDWPDELTSIAFTPTNVLNSGSGAAGAVVDDKTNLKIVVKCAANSANLWGMFEVTNTYTPISAEALTISISAVGRN